jgi:hypothetical protein
MCVQGDTTLDNVMDALVALDQKEHLLCLKMAPLKIPPEEGSEEEVEENAKTEEQKQEDERQCQNNAILMIQDVLDKSDLDAFWGYGSLLHTLAMTLQNEHRAQVLTTPNILLSCVENTAK